MSATSLLDPTNLKFTTDGTTIAAQATASTNTITFVGASAANVTLAGVANPTTAQQAATKSYVDGFTNGAALTKTDDTNVTLTLGGTPTTSLLRATSITAGWTGTLSGTRGGTGVNNGSNTLTLAGNLATSGTFASTFTMTGVTAITFPTSGTLATTTQLPTPAALTKADDTNVTLTLGGTPATALLQATSITAGWTGQLGLTRGGTNASLTASNGGIFYSTASAGAILSGTATANQVLLSGASATPAWSTATYPATTTVNQTLYSSSTNVITGLATANSAVRVTTNTGVPTHSSTMTDGQMIIGSTGATPVAANLTATNGLAITNGAGTASVGFTNVGVVVTYLVVAGGGGGGVSGAGGAGGMINTTQTLTASTVLTTSVGAGGAGGTDTGTAGNNSSITGTGFTTATAIAGGKGGGTTAAGSGGSGGGGNATFTTGGTGTVGQGNNGGNSSAGSAAGGGGAGGAGSSGTTTNGGAGGVGLSSTITGTTVFYAGGGGGRGSSVGGAGGNGGGGAGGTTTLGTSGTANTGGGGGGSGIASGGGAGGSGIVIIRIPAIYYGGFTGTGTAIIAGSDVVVSFTAGAGSLTITIPSSGVVINNNLTVTGTITTGITSYCLVFGSGTQSMPGGNTTTFANSFWSGTVTTMGTGISFGSGLFTISSSGLYMIMVQVGLTNAAPASALFYVGPSTIASYMCVINYQTQTQSFSGVFPLLTGATFGLYVFNGGATGNLSNLNGTAFFSVTRIA
jgi:hypothetical protein